MKNIPDDAFENVPSHVDPKFVEHLQEIAKGGENYYKIVYKHLRSDGIYEMYTWANNPDQAISRLWPNDHPGKDKIEICKIEYISPDRMRFFRLE